MKDACWDDVRKVWVVIPVTVYPDGTFTPPDTMIVAPTMGEVWRAHEALRRRPASLGSSTPAPPEGYLSR